MGILRDQFIEYLTLKGYSEQTIKTYTSNVDKLSKHYNTAPTKLTEKQIREFFVYLKNEKKIAPISYNQYHASIHCFLSFHNKEHLMKSIPRCKNHRHKPVVLSKEEVIRIIESIKNIKHKTIIAFLYSAGLRLNEAVNIKLSDIDRDRKQIFIRNAKGNKDRYSILSNKCLELLDEHIKVNVPTDYVFYSNQNTKAPIHKRTVQKIFQTAVTKAGITKNNVSTHTLRHSFATHLLEESVNLRHIQTILGHANLSSTAVYLHTVSLDKLNVQSPLDTNP